MNLTELTDADLDAHRVAVLTEQERRQTLTATPSLVEDANRRYLAAEGTTQGDPWRPVTGYHDAYPSDWEVTHAGKTWVALRNGASGEPGLVSGDWQEKQESGEVVDWVMPQAGSEYPVGALVRHNGRTWRNDHTSPNGWEPGTNGSQWTDIGPA